jgi:predicted flap endonuclease-1-like 5' DNA nuclease
MTAMANQGPADPALPRQTLAMRLAERERQRSERAERLARLHPAAAKAEAPAPAPAPEPAAVLHFQRPEMMTAAVPETDLDRLPGAGPGLVGALRRAGLARLADVAPLAPEALAARLGPIGRLVPAEAWVAAAREAGPPA